MQLVHITMRCYSNRCEHVGNILHSITAIDGSEGRERQAGNESILSSLLSYIHSCNKHGMSHMTQNPEDNVVDYPGLLYFPKRICLHTNYSEIYEIKESVIYGVQSTIWGVSNTGTDMPYTGILLPWCFWSRSSWTNIVHYRNHEMVICFQYKEVLISVHYQILLCDTHPVVLYSGHYPRTMIYAMIMTIHF